MSTKASPHFLVLILICFGSFLYAQNANSSRSLPLAAATVRDSNAIASLRQMLGKTGWLRPNIPVDVVATGTITVFGEDDSVLKSGTLTAKSRGRDHYYLETIYDGDALKALVLGRNAFLVDGEKKSSVVPSSVFSPLIPFFTDLTEVDDSTLNVTVSRSNGSTKITIWRETASVDPSKDVVKRTSLMAVSIDETTGLPIAIEYMRSSPQNSRSVRLRTRKLADLHQVRGVLVPFSQEEWEEGRRLFTIRLTDVVFDVGVNDDVFGPDWAKGGQQ